MAIENRKLGGTPNLVINLKDLFNVDEMPDDEGLRHEIGLTVIDKLKERSESGYDKDGKKFAPYSKAYINSLEFKAFGKSANDVNLRLSGDMMESLEVLRTSRNTITIGFGSEENALKAMGHITGDVGVKRDFFGLPRTDYLDIREEFDMEVAVSNLGEDTFSSILGNELIRLGDLLDE